MSQTAVPSTGAPTLDARRLGLPVALVAAVFLVTVELLRAASPMLDLAAGEIGFLGAAGLALAVFTAPVLVGPLAGVLGVRRASFAAVGTLVVLRLVAQAVPVLPVIAAGAVVGIVALVLVVRTTPRAAVGVVLGTLLDLVVRGGYGSWDPIFRPGVWPWVSTVLICGAAVAVLAFARPDPARGRAGVLGPYLALYVLAYGSPPILAAHAGIPLAASGWVLVATTAAGLFLLTIRLPWVVPALGVVIGVAAGYWAGGPLALVGMVVAGLSAPLLLARALAREGGGYASAGAAAGLGYLLPVMVYQLHYELEFPFDNRLALLVAAGWLAIAALAGVPGRFPVLPNQRMGAVLCVIVALLALTDSTSNAPEAPEPDQSGATVRLMSWNLKYGRHHTDGTVDLESIAATVERVDPDVLLLQEVSRGWPIGGGADMAEWLSDRLDMPYEWAPAADNLFGNAVLTRLPLSDVDVERLPFVQGPMHRSYLAATVQLDGGRELHLINAHLQHRTENTPTRLVQSEALLSAWDGAPHTVIAGDFNFWPSWPERELFDAAGLVSAQDITGHGAEFTTPTDDPDNRVDWIFGTPDLAFSGFAVLTDATNSDHFPLVVTVELE